MAATGKKSKKAKWIPASITDIIAEPTTIPATHNWADSVDDEPENSYGGGGYQSRQRAPVVLPSASRAARGGLAVDDESIPRRPPFTAHISNLPYDVDESAITELFTGLKIINLRVPREGDRLKGYGCIDFEDRESLINAMNIADLTIGGRRIRIEVSTQDNDRRMGRGGRSDRDREYDPERTMGDWRSGPRAMPDTSGRERRDERPRPERGPMDRSNMDRGNMDRDRERDSSADNRPGGWRDGERPAAPEPARAPYGGRDSFGRDRFEGRDRGGGFGGREREAGAERSGYGGRDGFRTAERDGGGFGSREGRGFGGRNFGDRDRERDPPPREDAKPRERPKLNLLPRTLPREPEPRGADGAPDDKLPDKSAPKPVSAEKVFGAAKPVDTAAKEREIEERLRKKEEEARRGGDEKERWGRRNDHSGERRAAPKRDEGPRDSRSYNRDRRDYSKDDKDRRDYKDDRDRRDYRERDDAARREPERAPYPERERRDYSPERRRNYSPDRRPRRDYSGDRRRDYSGERRREYSGERRDSRDDRDYKDGERERRPDSREREKDRDTPKDRDTLKERDAHEGAERERDANPRDERDANPRDERNGRARPSRSRDRHDEIDDKTMPKIKEQEKPNFVASNKFSYLEDADDGTSE